MTKNFQPELLSGRLDGRLTADESAALESHVKSHADDARLFADLQQQRNDLRALSRLAAPAGLQSSIMQMVRSVQSELADGKPLVATPAQFWTNTAWLVACAASLVGIIATGAAYQLGRRSSQIAQVDQREGETSERINGQASLGGIDNSPVTTGPQPGDRPGADPSLAFKELPGEQTAKTAASPVVPNDVADMPPIIQPPPGDLSPADPSVVKDAVASGAPGGLGGAMSEKAKASATPAAGATEEARRGAPLAKGDALAANADRADSSNLKPFQIAAASCVNFDQLIVVQIPQGQSSGDWVASIFQQADVQIDANEPNSFQESFNKRQMALARDAQAKESRNDIRAEPSSHPPVDKSAVGDAKTANLSGSGVRQLEEPAMAYLIDADIQQLRQIVDRLEGATIVGFPNPVLPSESDGESGQPKQDAYSANPAIARRLQTQFLMRGPKEEARPTQSQVDSDPAAIKQQSQSQAMVDALGLDKFPSTTRHRILFVFQASPTPATPSSQAAPIEPAGN